jgi:type IV secretion system protein VirB3
VRWGSALAAGQAFAQASPFSTGATAFQGNFLATLRPIAVITVMALGVTYSALLVNGIVTIELYLRTRNLLWLLVCLPIHGLTWLLCASEPRIFDLRMLWGRTKGPGLLGNGGLWRANGYASLVLDLPDGRGRRRAKPWRP